MKRIEQINQQTSRSKSTVPVSIVTGEYDWGLIAKWVILTPLLIDTALLLLF